VGAAQPGEPAASPNASQPGGPPASSSSAQPSVARTSGILALGTLASRITGFGKAAVVAAAIGLGPLGSAYTVATQLPTFVYELLLGGILTGVVVPLLVKAEREDPDGGKAYTDRLLSLAVVLFGAVTVLAVAAAPLIARVYVEEGPKAELVTTLGRLALLVVAFLGLSALFSAVLNLRGRYVAVGWAPVVNNLVVIALAGVLMVVGTFDPSSATGLGAGELVVLGLTFPLGVGAQALVLWVALRRSGYRWRWRLDVRNAGLGEIGRLARWMLLYVAVSQVGIFVIVRLADAAERRGGPGNAVHTNAFLLFMLPHGIAAVSVMTALLPQMSRAAEAGRLRDLAGRLELGTRLIGAVLVPATAAYLALGLPIAVLAFQRGAVTPELARATGLATAVAAVGLVPFAVNALQVFAFYALRDTRTPVVVNAAAVGVKIAVDIGLYLVLPPDRVVLGLMVGNSVSYAVAVLVSARLLRQRIGPLHGARVARTFARVSLAALVAGLIGGGIGYAAQVALGTGQAGALVAVVAGGGALVLAYLSAAIVLQVDEVTDVLATVRRRLPGGRSRAAASAS